MVAENTDTGAFDIWADDLLGRKEEAQLVIDFLLRRCDERKTEGRNASYVLNLDAPWGEGKTFFLARLQRQLSTSGFTAVVVNAWQSDFASDPLTPVISALNETFSHNATTTKRAKKMWSAVRKHGAEIVLRAGKHGAATFGKKYLGNEFADDLGDILAKEDAGAVAEAAGKSLDELLDEYSKSLLKEFSRTRDSMTKFRTALQDFVSSGRLKPPLFVLLDELDRCRPSYALALLERIKHLFDVPGVVFVLATDTPQLGHAVRSVYGDRFDADRYLLRFFDRTYTFATPDRRRFIAQLFAEHNLPENMLSSPMGNDNQKLFDKSAASFGLTLRDIKQCFDLLRNFVTLWPPREGPIELLYLLPLIFAYHARDEGLFDALAGLNLPNNATFRGKPIGEFQIEFERTDDWGRPKPRESVSSLRLLRDMMASIRVPLPDAASRGGEDGPSGWVRDRFNKELRTRHPGSWQSNNPPRSLLLQYGGQVRAVGRFGA